MQYRLRTLLILMALGPPMLASSWFGWLAYREHQRDRENSLMMTITPALIIQEEEELTLGLDLQDS
jgi:hypothetical protein